MNVQDIRSKLDARLHSLEKEREALWMLWNRQDQQVILFDLLNPTLFYHAETKELFQYSTELWSNSKTVSPASVANLINLRCKPARVMAIEEEHRQVTNTVPLDSPDTLCDHLVTLFKNRIIYYDILQVGNSKFMNAEDPDAITAYISDKLIQTESGKQEISMEKATQDALQKILHPKPSDKGKSIGIDQIDRVFGGFKKDRLWVIGGESGTGKTAIVVEFIHRLCHFYNDEIAILFFSLEMSEDRIVRRLISRDAFISNDKMDQKFSTLSANDKININESGKKIMNYNLEIVYDSIDVLKMKARARRFALENKGKHLFIFLDHVGKVEGSTADIRQETIKVSACMKSFCTNYGATSFLLTQLKKEVGDGENLKKNFAKPHMGHIMESGAIRADADVVALLWRPDMYNKTIPFNGMDEWDCEGKFFILDTKNRDGQAPVDMLFNHRIMYNEISEPENPFAA